MACKGLEEGDSTFQVLLYVRKTRTATKYQRRFGHLWTRSWLFISAAVTVVVIIIILISIVIILVMIQLWLLASQLDVSC